MDHSETHRSAPREFTPRSYPPFPVGNERCVQLETFSLAKLGSGNESEQARLLEVCKTRGFFYLNFEDTHAQSLSAEAEEIGRLAEQVFKLPHEEKVKYAFGSSSTTIFGYDDKTLLPT